MLAELDDEWMTSKVYLNLNPLKLSCLPLQNLQKRGCTTHGAPSSEKECQSFLDLCRS